MTEHDPLPVEIELALVRGNGTIIAQHLRECLRESRSPHQTVIEALADMLSEDPRDWTDRRLVFKRRRRGNPKDSVKADLEQAMLGQEVLARMQELRDAGDAERGLEKAAAADIAQRRRVGLRTVRSGKAAVQKSRD